MYLLGRRAICAHGRIEYRYRGCSKKAGWQSTTGTLKVERIRFQRSNVARVQDVEAAERNVLLAHATTLLLPRLSWSVTKCYP